MSPYCPLQRGAGGDSRVQLERSWFVVVSPKMTLGKTLRCLLVKNPNFQRKNCKWGTGWSGVQGQPQLRTRLCKTDGRREGRKEGGGREGRKERNANIKHKKGPWKCCRRQEGRGDRQVVTTEGTVL